MTEAHRQEVSIEEYHDRRQSGPWISHSALKYAFKVMPDKEWVWTPHMFKHYLNGRMKTFPTRDQDIGTIFHCLCEGADPKILVCDQDRRGTNAWKAWVFRKANELGITVDELERDYVVLKESEDKKLLDMYKSLKNNKIVQEVFKEERVAKEGTVRWEDADFKLKMQARPDLETVKTIVDYKTAASAEDWLLNAYDHGYHRQSCMQVRGVQAVSGVKKRMLHLVIGKNFPYEVLVYELPPNAMALAYAELSEICQRIRDWMEFDQWDSPWDTRIINTDFPMWVYKGKAI